AGADAAGTQLLRCPGRRGDGGAGNSGGLTRRINKEMRSQFMSLPIKVGMVSLGCPKNQVDAEIMLHKIKEAGFQLETDAGLSDMVIINTCGFIESAKQEAIEQILEFLTLKQEGRIKKVIVTGCLA